MIAQEVIRLAREQIGTPFVHQGRVPGRALDCAGLVVVVAHGLGVEYNDVPAYGPNPADGLLQKTLESQPCIEKIPVADRQPGDVLLMRFATEPQHLAICAGETVIHSYMQVGKVCEHRLADVWVARIVAAYRFREAA